MCAIVHVVNVSLFVHYVSNYSCSRYVIVHAESVSIDINKILYQ